MWFAPGTAGIEHPVTKAKLKPRPPADKEITIAETQDPRAVLADWMTNFGRPNASSECPCERDAKPSVVQALHLMNSTKLQEMLTSAKGRATRLPKSDLKPQKIMEELYLACYSRLPTAVEAAIAGKALDVGVANRQAAIEDVLWSLLNSAEFVFNH